MITVMGATGHTGSGVAEKLLGLGKKVRVLGRSAGNLSGPRPLAAGPHARDDHAHDVRVLRRDPRGRLSRDVTKPGGEPPRDSGAG